MNPLYNIFLIIVGCILFFCLIEYFFIINKLQDYLIAIGEKETLRKIKGIDIFDKKTIFLYVSWLKVHRVLLEKYKQTNDNNYLLFDKKYINNIKKQACFIALFFIFIVCSLL